MADFRKKLFGLSCAVMMFTGMAFGQNLCSTTTTATASAPAGASFIRQEGQTELLPQLTITCSASGAGGAANISLYLSPAVSITSKVITGSFTEALATINGASVAGTVIGSSVSFAAVPFTTGATTVTISNVRINASSLPAGTAGSLPTPIAAKAFISGTGVTPTPSGAINVAYAFSGLGANTGKVYRDQGDSTSGTLFGGSNTSTYAVCSSSNTSSTNSSNSPNFFVAVNEGFTNAFKTQADEQSQVALSAVSSGGAATTTAFGTTTAVNYPNSGTRVKLVFSNVPAGLGIYVGQVVNAGTIGTTTTPVTGDGAVLTLVASETAPSGAANVTTATTSSGFSGTVGSGATAYAGGFVLLTVSGTTATAIYEVSTDNLNSLDAFSIPVLLTAGSNKVTPGAALTVTTSLAPQPATAASIVPSFSSTAASIVTTSTLTFAPCTTNLLFPFVTNANGFETGIAISNTTKDPFGTTTQSGLCTLNFYQSGVSGATNPTAVTAPNLAEGTNQPYLAGETYAFTLTQALGVNTANPATFQGYIIAQCSFNLGHAFAYILGGLQPGMFVNPTNTAMGYLAIVLPRGNTGSTADSNGN